MSDARSKRKARVVPFISMLDKDRQVNLLAVIDRAKKLELEGFESIQWKETTWKVNEGRLIKQAGKNCSNASLIFHYPEKISDARLNGDWADLIKALVILRFHRKNQSISNQRAFIASASYVAYEAQKHGQRVAQLTPEHLDLACRSIAAHYSKGAAYNMQKFIAEFAAHCDVNGLCKTHLNYKFSGMKRPDSTSGVGYKRLDDPETENTKSDKIISADVFRILGKLYQNVPKNHKYRFYILILTLLACLGRRFSEISLLPNQNISRDDDGRAFIEYFPMGLSSGTYSHWIAVQCTHSMMTTFLRYFDSLVTTYAATQFDANFTSHHFRHTLNTLLDEGGLSELLQTEWFGRTNPRDTKAYQHTSREKRALMLREDIKKGQVSGKIVEKLKSIPITVQDAFLKARINAVRDVGAGICIHNFVQTPCERHLQCSADCKDYVWVKNDKGRIDDLKRQYSMAVIARETSQMKINDNNLKRSIDWLAHNDKKLNILSKQLADNNIAEFDPHQYLEELTHE